jgi:hypothetical protein
MSPYRWRGVAFVLLCPAWAAAQSAAHGAESAVGNQRDVSHISGSIYPTVVLPSRAGASAPPAIVPAPTAEVDEDVTSVCLASAGNFDHCGALANTASAASSSHMAYCDIDDVGFAKCLSRYSRVLVRHPPLTKQSLRVEVIDGHGNSEALAVLATASATHEQITAEVRKDRPDVTIVSVP